MFRRISCGAVCAAVLAAGFQMSAVLSQGTAGSWMSPVLCGYAAVSENAEDYNNHASVKNGLVKEGGYFYYYEEGEPVTGSWITADNDTYYFGSDGRAAVFSCKIKGTYYVFDQDGKLQQPSGTKIVKVEAGNGKIKKYYVNKNGEAVSGWSKDQNYYFDETGEMVTGIIVLKAKFYCFNTGGKYNKAKTQKIRKAAGYEKPLAELLKYIGKPKKSKYYASCYGDGKDGILTYDGFTVYTFKPKTGAEIFMGVE